MKEKTLYAITCVTRNGITIIKILVGYAREMKKKPAEEGKNENFTLGSEIWKVEYE